MIGISTRACVLVERLMEPVWRRVWWILESDSWAGSCMGGMSEGELFSGRGREERGDLSSLVVRTRRVGAMAIDGEEWLVDMSEGGGEGMKRLSVCVRCTFILTCG